MHIRRLQMDRRVYDTIAADAADLPLLSREEKCKLVLYTLERSQIRLCLHMVSIII